MGDALPKPSVGQSSSPSKTTGQAAPQPSRPSLLSIGRLPTTSLDLFGRETDLEWLDTCWSQGVRVASIIAPGGVGKSSLVNAWRNRMDNQNYRGAERVYAWSFYSQGTDRQGSSDLFFSDLFGELGDAVVVGESLWDRGKRLARLLRQKRTLLILDGLEPLQEGPRGREGKLRDQALEALLRELGAENPGLCVITSRLAVRDLEGLSRERVCKRDLTFLTPEAGAELLRARGAKGKEEGLREASAEYKGHSLALVLLGSYLAEVAGGDIRQRKEIGPLMEEDLHGDHARRVMEAYEAWLEPSERAILSMLGLFDRPVEPDEIAALREEPSVVGLTDALVGVDRRTWRKALVRLRRVGLLDEGQDDRLDTHPLVREHFGEQLKQKHAEAWREGHRRLYEYLKRKAKDLPETRAEMEPLYAAVVHGCLAGKNQEALDEVHWARIQRRKEHFNTKKLGAFGSQVAFLSAFFDLPWERLAPGLSEDAQGHVLAVAAFSLRAVGRLQEAVGPMRAALERAIALEKWENAAISASNLSQVLYSLGNLRDAVDQARESVSFADNSDDDFQRMVNRTMLAAAQHAMDLREQAAALFEEAERMQKESEPKDPLLYSIQGSRYCDLLLEQRKEREVLERATKALEIATRYQWLLSIAHDHLSLGRAHLLSTQRGTAGSLTEATSHLNQAVNGLRHAGHQDDLPLGLLTRAALHTHTRNFPDAHADLDEALSLATRSGMRLHEADAHLAYARLHLAEGHSDEARKHRDLAQKLIQDTGYHRRDSDLEELEHALKG